MGLASQAVKNLGGIASNLGDNASGISSTLTPFLTRQLNTPQGYSQQDQSAMLAASAAGAGGATSGIVGQANDMAARTNNAGGYAGVLDNAARQQAKAAAAGAEGIASQNAGVKLDQQHQAAGMLQGLYGTNLGAQSSDLGIQAQDIHSAQNEGFMARLQQISGMLAGGASAASGVKTAFR